MYFPNPFPGRAPRLRLSGLLLLCPSIHTRLYGGPGGGLGDTTRGEDLRERFIRWSAGMGEKGDSDVALIREMLALAAVGTSNQDSEFKTGGRGRSFESPPFAPGDWELLYKDSDSVLDYPRAFRIQIERASHDALLSLKRSDFDGAIRALSENRYIKHLLWENVLQLLHDRTPLAILAPAQAAIAMEAELSCLAALDVELQGSDGRADTSRFSMLLPSSPADAQNVPARFFQWVIRSWGLPFRVENNQKFKATVLETHPVKLKTWNAGNQMPDEAWLNLALNLCEDAPSRAEAGSIYWAAKILTMLGYYAQQCVVQAAKVEQDTDMTQWQPWPSYPHNHGSYADWVAARYPFWLQYHRNVRWTN